METRLNKFVSESAAISRREADRAIEAGRVRVNGKIGKLGDKITSKDRIQIDGEEVGAPRDAIYLAFHKPRGVTCTTDTRDGSNIVDYINYPHRIFNVGRLDKDSEGLIFMTNDGDIVNKILRAGNGHEKEYLVSVDKVVTDDFVRGMSSGVPILGVMTRKCKVERVMPMQFRIVLTQGLNRQIRRMCEHFGYNVTQLVRTRIMNVSLKGLGQGEFRDLTDEEVASIMKMVEKSTKTAAPPKTGNTSKPSRPKVKSAPERERSFKDERFVDGGKSRGGGAAKKRYGAVGKATGWREAPKFQNKSHSPKKKGR